MSAFSDAGKTVSSVFSALRKTAELGETVVGDRLLTGIVNNLGDIVNISLKAAADQTKVETEIEMRDFLAKYRKQEPEIIENFNRNQKAESKDNPVHSTTELNQ